MHADALPSSFHELLFLEIHSSFVIAFYSLGLSYEEFGHYESLNGLFREEARK